MPVQPTHDNDVPQFQLPASKAASFSMRFSTLAIVVIGFLLGVVAASFSARFPSGSWMNVLLLTLGSGFISTAVISSMLDLVWSKARANEEKGHLVEVFKQFEGFMDRLQKLEGRLTAFKQVGLNYCDSSRTEAIARFLGYAKETVLHSANNQGCVEIVSSSARGLIGHIDGGAAKVQIEWRNLITQNPTRFKILLTHPAYAHLRQAAEERPSGEIEIEILKTAAFLYCIAGMDSKYLRFYRGSPTVFAIQADKHILLNPYPYGNMAMDTLSLEFESEEEDSYVARFVRKHFIQTWKFVDQEGKQVDNQPLVQGVDNFESILDAFSECTFLGDPKRLRLARAQIRELDHFVTKTLKRDCGDFRNPAPEGDPFMAYVQNRNLRWSDMEICATDKEEGQSPGRAA